MSINHTHAHAQESVRVRAARWAVERTKTDPCPDLGLQITEGTPGHEAMISIGRWASDAMMAGFAAGYDAAVTERAIADVSQATALAGVELLEDLRATLHRYAQWFRERAGQLSMTEGAHSGDCIDAAAKAQSLTRMVGRVNAYLADPTTPRSDVRAKALSLVQDLDGLMGDSIGVAGLHLNGDVAPWDDLRQGGAFEDWLKSFDALIDALDPPVASKDGGVVGARSTAAIEAAATEVVEVTGKRMDTDTPEFSMTRRGDLGSFMAQPVEGEPTLLLVVNGTEYRTSALSFRGRLGGVLVNGAWSGKEDMTLRIDAGGPLDGPTNTTEPGTPIVYGSDLAALDAGLFGDKVPASLDPIIAEPGQAGMMAAAAESRRTGRPIVTRSGPFASSEAPPSLRPIRDPAVADALTSAGVEVVVEGEDDYAAIKRTIEAAVAGGLIPGITADRLSRARVAAGLEKALDDPNAEDLRTAYDGSMDAECAAGMHSWVESNSAEWGTTCDRCGVPYADGDQPLGAVGVNGEAGPTPVDPFVLTTTDPAFDPTMPVSVNGFLFFPTRRTPA